MDLLINKINQIQNNHFIKKLQTNNTTMENFLNIMVDFGYVVNEWSNLLSILIKYVPSVKERFILIKNLYDEHGNGNIMNAHVNTYDLFLKSISKNMNLNIQSNFVHLNMYKNFVDKLYVEFENNQNNWIKCVCILGMIEKMYVTISLAINDYLRKYI